MRGAKLLELHDDKHECKDQINVATEVKFHHEGKKLLMLFETMMLLIQETPNMI